MGTPKEKNTDFFVLLCLPASFLIREGQPRPPLRLTFFLGRGGPSPPLIFVSVGPPQTDILWGGDPERWTFSSGMGFKNSDFNFSFFFGFFFVSLCFYFLFLLRFCSIF